MVNATQVIKGIAKNRKFERKMTASKLSSRNSKTDKEKSEELKQKRIQEIKKEENK